jgi:TolB-like protein
LPFGDSLVSRLYLSFARLAPPRGRIHSLAVLPLDNLSSNTDEMYFADGMTDFWIVIAPEFDSLHSEPRYQKIVHDMHLTLPS